MRDGEPYSNGIPNGALQELAGLQDEISQYLSSSRLEMEGRKKLVEALRPLLISVGRPLSLHAPLLRLQSGGHVTLDSRCVLTTVDSSGMSLSKPLLDLDAGVFLSVVEEAARELIKISSKGQTGLLEQNQPKLKANVKLAGRGAGESQGKNNHLVLSNSGGDARKLRVAVTFRDKTKTYTIVESKRGQETDIDLSYFGPLTRPDSIKLLVTCEMVGGVRYKGRSFVSLRKDQPRNIRLKIDRVS